MTRILAAWGKLGLAQRIVALTIPFALIVAVGAAAVFALASGPGSVAVIQTPDPSPTASLSAPSPTQTLTPSPSPSPSLTPTPAGPDPLLGTDGRLTVLLLGSDYRPAHPGNRTDAIMVVSVDPTTGKAAGFSVPRDTSGFPLGNGKYGAKVNALYQHLQSTSGNGGLALSKAVGKAFNIEIDGYVLIGFEGVKDLVAAVGGVDVTLDKPYYDAHYWVTARHEGWGLPAGRSHLSAKDALIFARSRKGDNDFGRARRQQQLVIAAIAKVRLQGVAKLPRLLQIASRTVRTNLPLARASDLFDIVAKTDISKIQRVVFGPTTYASGAGGTSFELKLSVCRNWIRSHFPPIRPMGQWPAVSTPSPSSGASPSP
jgi:LCP family protein required for cell wall assembly